MIVIYLNNYKITIQAYGDNVRFVLRDRGDNVVDESQVDYKEWSNITTAINLALITG